MKSHKTDSYAQPHKQCVDNVTSDLTDPTAAYMIRATVNDTHSHERRCSPPSKRPSQAKTASYLNFQTRPLRTRPSDPRHRQSTKVTSSRLLVPVQTSELGTHASSASSVKAVRSKNRPKYFLPVFRTCGGTMLFRAT